MHIRVISLRMTKGVCASNGIVFVRLPLRDASGPEEAL